MRIIRNPNIQGRLGTFKGLHECSRRVAEAEQVVWFKLLDDDTLDL